MAGHWDFTQTNSLSGQIALIVGYGSIGTAAEAQLVPFGVTVERIAQEPATTC